MHFTCLLVELRVLIGSSVIAFPPQTNDCTNCSSSRHSLRPPQFQTTGMTSKAGQRLGALARRMIEVESKFTPTEHSLKLLRGNLGWPPFTTLRPCASVSFTDQYYDHDGILERQGIWARKREGIWEAKCRRAGDFIDSAFEEVEGEASVAQVVLEACRGSKLLGLDHLRCTAAFRTMRSEWLANERFRIAVDVTDFGHRVGEVEITEEVFGGEDGSETGENLTGALRNELNDFMASHVWAFPGHSGTKPISKLSAYYALSKPPTA